MAKRFLFVSYARDDFDRIRPLVDAVRLELESRALPVEIWTDVSNLQPGEQWQSAITQALNSSIGFLFFVSPRTLQSEWVRHELSIAAADPNRLIIPVILHKPLDLPRELAMRQWIDFTGRRSRKDIATAAARIADAVASYLQAIPKPPSAVSAEKAPFLAADIAQELRAATEPAPNQTGSTSVFVVHGHDAQALAKLEDYLASVGIAAVVLARQYESPQSLFQKFMAVATKASFAIVLLSADDYGASRIQYEADGVGDRALQFRARQNVVLELGFFYGRLGWENVFVVQQDPDRVFPNFERPSDLDGVVFDSMKNVGWQKKLSEKLAAAGFTLAEPA
ncbi:MAG: TIR domain-containing protein [Longimicrobiaceae bacterium]